MYIIIIGLVFLFGYGLYLAISSLISALPKYLPYIINLFENISENILKSFENDYIITNYLISLPQTIGTTMLTSLTEWASEFVGNFFGKFPSLLISIIVTLIAGCYIAGNHDNLKLIISGKIKEETKQSAKRLKDIFVNNILKMGKGYAILMLITYVELCIGLAILGCPKFYLVAAGIAVIDILPILGVGAVLIPWAIFVLLLGNIKYFIGLLVLWILIIIIRNIIEPKIVGDQIGVPPILMLAGMYIGLKLFNIIGLLGIPIILSIYFVYRKSLILNENNTQNAGL